MSNVLRAKLKKLARNDKKTERQKPKEGGTKRGKGVPASPPEPNANGNPRKSSLGTDSPVHASNRPPPTSPLVVSKSTSTSHIGRRESSHSLSGTGMQPPVPTVNIGSYDVDPSLDREGVIGITAYVQNFLAAVSSLKKAMEEADTVDDVTILGLPPSSPPSLPPSTSSQVFSNLSDLIHVAQSCLEQHPAMQSTEIKDAAKHLTTSYQSCPHQNASTCSSCNQVIEALIDAFTKSVQEYLTGDTLPNEPPMQHHKKLHASGLSSTNMLKGFSKSHENLASLYSSYMDLSQQFNEPIVDQIDQALMGVEHAVEVATRYIKIRTKYHKEMTTYLNKRAQIEAKYQQQMMRLGKTTQLALTELRSQEECLPLIDLFRASVDQDMKFASNCNTTFSLQVGTKLIEHLERKITECERVRRELTQTWQREQKKLAEAKTAMKNAKAKYRFLGEDLSRVKNILAADPYGKQAEKRKKEVSDLEIKWQEAETAYKNAVADCNDCQYQVHVAAQKSILCAYRRAVIDVDMALKSGLEKYFQLEHNFFTSLPDPVHQKMLDVREYQVGTDFMRYVQRHPQRREEPEDFHFEEYDPDLEGLMDPSESLQGEGTRLPNSNSAEVFLSTEDSARQSERASSPQPLPAWDSASVINDTSSTSSPRSSKRKQRPRSMAFLIDPTIDSPQSTLQRRNSDQSEQAGKTQVPISPPPQPEEPAMSKNAITHTLKKLRGPARCRECDTYVYFHGYECEVCGLACHKRCLATLAIRCGSKRLARKMNTFGVDFHKHLKATKRFIPIIVTKCINEIDDRGLDTKGLYRISCAKTKIEHLCQLFESGADRVDLSDRPCHLIGSCLKLYFRQLPEPLLTFGLYHEFISFGREASHTLPCNMEKATEDTKAVAMELLEQLRGLLQKLPYENFITLARLLFHLNRVSSPDNIKHNCMPASNLGIVFGPNLLRQRDMVASLALLADMTAQAKVIEILISHVHEVFRVTEDHIIREVEQEYDDSETTEVLVDEVVEPLESTGSSRMSITGESELNCLNVDDLTANSRTPCNTPPEKRRRNVHELGEVLEVLQSVSSAGWRGSSPGRTLRHSHTEELHSSSQFSNLPGAIVSERDTLSPPSRFHRPQTTPPLGFDKMLTPVEEWPADEENGNGLSPGEDDHYIISSACNKLDSEEGVTPGDMESEEGSVRELDPEESGISILSGEFDTPPRLLGLSHSMEDIIDSSFGTTKRFEEDIAKLIQSQSSNDSSQGSDDSSPFSSENVQALLDRSDPQTSPRGALSLPSSVEGTPVRSLGEGRRPNSSNGHPQSYLFPELSPQHFHTRKHPTQHYTQSDNVSTKPHPPVNGHLNFDDRSNPRSFSGIVNTYSRYKETPRTVDPSSALEGRAEGDAEGKSQDSNGTLTEGDSTSTTNENIEDHHQEAECVDFEKSKCAKEDVLALRQLKDVHKQTDSGIEEVGTPDAGRTDDYDGISGTNEEDVPLPDDSKTSKSLSYATLFTSCESGLDSPDPESIIDDHSKTNPRPPSEDLKKDPRVEIFTARMRGTSPKPIIRLHQTSYSQTSLSSDGSSDLGPSVAEILEDHRNTSGNECAAPRSLEGPNFSRYARVPIRHCDSKHALLPRSTDTPDRLRYRTSSLDETSSDGDGEGHVQLERQSSTESTTSESNLDIGFRVVHQPAGVFQVEQRFKRRSLSESGLSTVTTRSWKTNSPLHVLRIIPNARTTPPPADRSNPTMPDGTRSSSSPEVQTLRLRMASPETPQQPRLVKMPLIHSKSDNDFDNSGVELTKVGSLYVIPEVKPRSVSIGSDGKAAEDSLCHSTRSTADVTDIDHSNRVSVESFGSTGSSDSNSQSPKNSRRGRAPQFV